MLAALGYWGFEVGDGVLGFVLGLGAPLLAIAMWGMFVAPKAKRPVSIPARLAIEILLFGAAAAVLVAVGWPATGTFLGVLALATSFLNASQERQENR